MSKWSYVLVVCLITAALSLVLLFAPFGETNRAEADFTSKIEPLAQKNYVETIPGSEVKFEMIAIPGGTFLMGSPATEPDRANDEGPQHPVQIRPFWMEKTETTWDEYDLFFKEKGVESPEENEKRVKGNADAITGPTKPYADETFGHGRDGPRPVLCITHHAAMEYCRWLSAKTGKTYRLPTEAEWEYACRAGTTTAYSFGAEPEKLDEYAWYSKNAEDDTHPVGQKKPNPWGLHDMHGNVAEWCLDMYQKDYYSTFPADKLALAPVKKPTAARFSHVARGGAWTDDGAKLRSAARRASDRSWIKRDPQRPQSIWWLTDAEFVGFRIVRPVEEQDNLKGLRPLVTRDSPDFDK
jgi:formylglycine-generating enzyme required for sulfatase activity